MKVGPVSGHKLVRLVRNEHASHPTATQQRWTVHCECGWLEDADTKAKAEFEHAWHKRKVKERRDFADELDSKRRRGE